MKEITESRKTELRAKIIEFYRNNYGKNLTFRAIGSDYYEAVGVLKEMADEGLFTEIRMPSKSGKRMMWKTVLTEQVK